MGILALLLGACGAGASPSSAPSAIASEATSPTPETSAPASAARTLKVGAMVWDTTNPFYSNFLKGMKDAGQKYGVELDIQNGQADLATQVAVVQQFITQKKDLIIVTPGDAQGIVPVIKQANAAGIPVIAANNKVAEGAEVVTFVGADDYQYGTQQGEMLVQAIGESGNVGYVLGALGTSPQVLREQGLMDVLKKHPGIKIVVKQTANWNNAQALAVVQDWLGRFPQGQLAAVLDQGFEVVSGAQWAAQNGRPEVKFLTGDFPADIKKAITDGVIWGTVDQDPYPQGFTAVEYAYFWLNGQQGKVTRPNDFLPLPIVTKGNVDQFPAAWGG